MSPWTWLVREPVSVEGTRESIQRMDESSPWIRATQEANVIAARSRGLSWGTNFSIVFGIR